jgi:uncharacterized membrane protein
MKPLIRWGLLTLAIAATVHAMALFAGPTIIMSIAMKRIAGEAGVNRWAFAPRTTPETQRVVRSSPDLAYAACAWDVSKGPVRIRAAGAADYASLSLYGANTDNFFSLNDRTMGPDGAEIVLIAKGAATPAGIDPAKIVVAPSRRGLALDRRLAPTAEAFARADAARRAVNLCETLPKG